MEYNDFEQLEIYLERADSVITPSNFLHKNGRPHKSSKYYVGADLGTAYIVLIALDENLQPLAGEYQFAQVVRDGLVVDYFGAIDRLKSMKENLEKRLGVELLDAAGAFPPGVPSAEIRSTANVIEAAGFDCVGLVDEPTAANNLLKIQNGAIVDIGGGTTGIAVLKNGGVVYTADEATGGTHFSLVIAGAKNIPFEAAEEIKKDKSMQQVLFPIVRPVMEKVADIINRHLNGQDVKQIYLVGGSVCFPGFSDVIEEYTGIKTTAPSRPLFVTPIGIAMHHAVSENYKEKSNG